MERDALLWIGVVFGLTLVAPVVFYLLTGTVLGFLLPCQNGVLEIVTYDGSSLAVACGAAGAAVKLGVAVWGTTLVGAVTFLVGFAELFSGGSRF